MLRLLVLVIGLVLAGPPAAYGQSVENASEPTRQDCEAGVARARALTLALPAEHPSRVFAESHLQQALTEAGNGEFDDCLEWVERAMTEVRERRHILRPGEKLDIRQANE